MPTNLRSVTLQMDTAAMKASAHIRAMKRPKLRGLCGNAAGSGCSSRRARSNLSYRFCSLQTEARSMCPMKAGRPKDDPFHRALAGKEGPLSGTTMRPPWAEFEAPGS